VLVLHIVIISMLQTKIVFLKPIKSAPHYLQYISIAQPESLPIFSPEPKPGKTKKADLRTSAASNLVTSASSINEAATEPTSSPPNDLPKLDLNTLRANAVQLERKRERSPIELQNERNRLNKSLEARLEKSAKKAERTDCRTTYSGTGLFAPLFITADLLSEKGCKF